MFGSLYRTGKGVPREYNEAVKWFRISAEQGAAIAQLKLSRMYADGLGVPQDQSEAVKWLQAAAEQDLATAQFSLAQLYAKGQGTPVDHVKAYAWLNLATSHACSGPTGQAIGRIMDTLREQMTAEQLAEAEKFAAELRERVKASKPK